MDQKMIKNALKEARDAIKNKNYAFALRLSKNVLKSDKDNYMALVFLGVSLQEVGPKEQAPLAFRKAILVCPDHALAWNGLATFYEKDDSNFSSKELIAIYEKLLQLETEVSKFSDLCTKLVNRAQQISETQNAAFILSKLVKNNEKLSENIKRCVWTNLFTVLTSQDSSNLSLGLQFMLEQTLAYLVSDRTTVCTNYYKEYLKLLYKLQKYDVLFTEAIKMQNLYESTIYPLEWIAKIYVELSVEENELANNFEEEIDKYCTKMLILQEDSVMAIFAQAVKKYRVKNYVESRHDLEKVVSLKSNLVYAWVFLSELLLILHNNKEALNCIEKAENLFKNLKNPSVALKNKIDGILLHTLAHQTNSDKLKKCLEIGNQLLEENPDDPKILVAIISAQINIQNHNAAENLLSKIPQNCPEYFLLKIKLFRHQGHLEKALSLVQEITEDSSELHLEIGLIHWSLSNYELSLISYLKSAKLNPNNYQCFTNLGKCYEILKNEEKAQKCYQKAFKLNPKCMEAGIGLSNIYRKQKNWEANFNLLQSVTQSNATTQLSIPPDNRWAVLQLGLNYFEQKDYTRSIDCLRNLIRSEPENGHYWECLGDAYMARGSYKTALKSFEHAIELTENVLYPKLQFATIKLLLGLHDEAKEVFEGILNENKYYIPALKGLAENYLNQTISQRKEQFLGRARENAQLSINYLTIALKERSDLSCLWKLTGNVCLLIADLPVSYCFLTVDSLLAVDGNCHLDKDKLYVLSARCFCKAISLTQSNILLWHNLAVNYYKNGCSLIATDQSESKLLINRALDISKYCVCHNDRNWQHWNLLGVISMHKTVENYPLAQHAFIKAVTINRNSAVAWTNLGTLYLKLNHLNLANGAYAQAQRGDPNYNNCWIGQALVAETMGHEDAMDLFRHSTQLNHHPQSAIGYANWVCRTILNSEPHVKLYSIHNMHAVPVAVDALSWYTENNPNDSCAWNMLGLLRERLGLKTSTVEAFEKARAFVDDKNRDKVLINCARSFVQVQEYKKGIELYKQVKNASFNHGCGLALALFKEEEYKESYESYDATMNCLTEDQTSQSHILVALAAITYLFNEVEDAKILLFRSTQLKPPSNWGLFATLAHGLLHKDVNLAELVLSELQPVKDNAEIVYHYSILLCLTHLRQGDKKSTIRSLIKSVHCHPGNAQLWQFLSILLLTLDADNKAKYAANFAEVSIKLGRSEMDVTKILGIAALACCMSQDTKKALTLAQKAVHSYPNLAENWSVLLTVLSYQKIDNWPSQLDFIKNRALHVKNNMNPSDELGQWFTEVK